MAPRLLLALLLFLGVPVQADDPAVAILAGGCFWCMESDFEAQEGVLDVISGFTGGTLKNPTYSGDHRGHFEAVKISYDPAVISYEQLLHSFWRSIDPFDNAGQFCDKGFSYRSAIFVGDDEERAAAEASLEAVAAHFPGRTIYTEIRDATAFWPVEEYHQDYYLKNPVRYKYYRWRCGRDQRLQELWGEEATRH